MKIIKKLENFGKSCQERGWDAYLDEQYKYRQQVQATTSLPENQFYGALVVINQYDTPDRESLLCTSEKRAYITKDCSKSLVGAHTQWNCIVEVEPNDPVCIL